MFIFYLLHKKTRKKKHSNRKGQEYSFPPEKRVFIVWIDPKFNPKPNPNSKLNPKPYPNSVPQPHPKQVLTKICVTKNMQHRLVMHLSGLVW